MSYRAAMLPINLSFSNIVDVLCFSASWLPKMTSDTNAGALDAGLDTALVFVDACPTTSIIKNVADSLCANAVDKAFGTRASTLNKYGFLDC
jgi:hypothetical protein